MARQFRIGQGLKIKNPANAGFFICFILGVYIVIESTLIHLINELSYFIAFFERKCMTFSVACNYI
jgi:hypothetical protein